MRAWSRNGMMVLAALLASCALAGQSARTAVITGRVLGTSSALDVSNAVIWVEEVEGVFPPPADPVVIDQKNLHFVPHVLPVLVGTTVEFPNSDPVLHNVFSISEAKRFNLGLYGHDSIRRMTFDKPGVVELLCNVHLEMSAYLVVVNNPYYAVTAADGQYRIDGVPAGRRQLRSWHERFEIQDQFVDVPESGAVIVNLGIEN